MSKRKNHSASFKAQVALQAYKGEKTLAELANPSNQAATFTQLRVST